MRGAAVLSSRPRRRTRPGCPARLRRTLRSPDSAGRSRPPCAARRRGRRVRRGQWPDNAPAIPKRCGLRPPPRERIRLLSLTLSDVRRDDYLTPAFPFVLAATRRAPRRRSRNAIYATLCRLLLPISHCDYKLGGQVSFAQQFDTAFFGTTVPSESYRVCSADVCARPRASRALTGMPNMLRKHAQANDLRAYLPAADRPAGVSSLYACRSARRPG
jgi:hypothetical protein